MKVNLENQLSSSDFNRESKREYLVRLTDSAIILPLMQTGSAPVHFNKGNNEQSQKGSVFNKRQPTYRQSN